jgi:hypothetical protein
MFRYGQSFLPFNKGFLDITEYIRLSRSFHCKAARKMCTKPAVFWGFFFFFDEPFRRRKPYYVCMIREKGKSEILSFLSTLFFAHETIHSPVYGVLGFFAT